MISKYKYKKIMEKRFVYTMIRTGETMKKFTAFILMISLMSGCAAGSTPTVSEGMSIEHLKGTTVVSEDIKKAAIFDFGILDTMETLGIESEIAIPLDSLPGYLDQGQNWVNAGGIKEPDMEALYSFAPDVIIISGRQADYYEELSKIAPTIYVEFQAATYFEDVEKNARMIAKLFKQEEKAETYLDELNKKAEEAKNLASQSALKAMILLTNDGSISAYGSGSRFGMIHDELSVKAIDENIEVSTHGQQVNYEYISQMNPDILYVVDRTQVVGGKVEGSATLANDLVNETKAAMNGRIIYLSADYWYLASGGLSAVSAMIDEAMIPFN